MPSHSLLTGNSPSMLELRQELERVAQSEAKVLLTGERGVGKELVAREIHARSPRALRAFVPVNCAGLPEMLLESELFGHVEGSFTGAYRDKTGSLETAHDGTIFLDEVGEMSLRLQGRLLRFLETGELQKVGSERVAGSANVRVIAATNRPLRLVTAQGLFREDLFYHLNAIHLTVPPLRERREDIPQLVEYFLRRSLSSNGSPVETIAPDAIDALVHYSWPGNVRQLENIIERLVVVGSHRSVTVDELPVEVRGWQPQPAAAPTAAAGSRSVPLGPAHHAHVVDHLYTRLTANRESFWTTVYPLYMQREITRTHVRDVVQRGLEEARGNYKIMVQLFNMEAADYKKFLNFLRKHQCQLPFKEYRQITHV